MNAIREGSVLRINQSTIKRLTDRITCPEKYYKEEITGEYRRPSSEAMVKGQYGEYKAFGTLPKEGGIPIIPPNKRTGQPTVDQVRIDLQVQVLHDVMNMLGMKKSKTDYLVEQVVGNVIFHGTQDVLIDWNGRPYIMDLKFTGDVSSTFGKFAWGGFTQKHPMYIEMKLTDGGVYIADWDKTKVERGEMMDTIQAHSYMYLMELLTGRPWGFIYFVLDYKKKPEFKVIEVPFNRAARENVLERLGDTEHKLLSFAASDYQPVPHISECKGCRINTCKVRVLEQPKEGLTTVVPSNEVVFFDDPFS